MDQPIIRALTEEFQRWEDAGQTVEFWWRDDDVQAPSPALTRLLAISDQYRLPLALAAVPDGVSIGLPAGLADSPGVSILQHGFSHRNHAPDNERKMELGWHRPVDTIRQQIRAGELALRGLFAERFVAIMVPPWNRIAEEVVELLPALGLIGLSTLGPRPRVYPVAGLKQLNVHVDIINWKNRCFLGEMACTEQLLNHLQAKRLGGADPGEPTGIMTHHLAHDEQCWTYLEDLFDLLAEHSGVKIVAAGDVV